MLFNLDFLKLMNRRKEVKYAVWGELQEITFKNSLFFFINMMIGLYFFLQQCLPHSWTVGLLPRCLCQKPVHFVLPKLACGANHLDEEQNKQLIHTMA